MAIYAVGEGWTGALTRKHVLDTIEGHYDEESWESESSPSLPALIYPNDNVKSACAGWGSSCFLDTNGHVYQVGRPQDVINLFRMNRMPEQVRKWINQNVDPSETTVVGSMISRLIGFATGGDENEEWEAARLQSLLHNWTKVDLSEIGDSQMSQIACGAGFMAMIGTSGTLYSMGINSRGQCGIGKDTNNIWTPQPVQGLAASTKQLHDRLEQEEPIVQVALGFQHGYAMTTSGRVFSWGKANRGQLGRDVDSDQEPSARPVVLDQTVTQISSGMHHGAALTNENQVFIWGKIMSKSEDRPRDAPFPEALNGLPENLKVLKIACGSHHTAVLLEDGSVYAVGVASDEAVPILDPVQMLPPGVLQLPVRQFEAHHDRTTVIDNDGQVLQMHLWLEESLRDFTAFTPGYVDTLWDQGHVVKSIHRGWLHTLIVTEAKNC